MPAVPYDRYTLKEMKEDEERAANAALARERAKAYEAFVLWQASEVSNKALDLSKNPDIGSDMRRLTLNLGIYLNQRRQEAGLKEISKRTKFIDNCITAIAEKKSAVLESHLKEENIRCFKGIISKRLYSIVSPYQFYSENRKKEVENSTIKNLPTVLCNLINECDQDTVTDISDEKSIGLMIKK